MTQSFGGVGALCKLAIGSSASQTRMDFLQFTPQIVKTLADGSTRAIRGTLDHQSTSVAEGLLHIRFRTSMWMTAPKLDVLLPQLGFTAVGNVYTLGDAIPDTTVILGPPGTKEHTFKGCVPTDFVIHGQHGSDPIYIDIGWIGRTWEEDDNGTFFVSQTDPPMQEGYVYPFAAGQAPNNASTLNILGQALAFPQFRLSLDYKTLVEFNNSITATNVMPSDHVLNFATSCLYNPADADSGTGSTEPLFDIPMSGDVDGASLTLNFRRAAPFTTPANYQTQIVVANAKLIARPPRIVKSDFTRLPINAQGYAVGSTPLLVITNKNAEA